MQEEVIVPVEEVVEEVSAPVVEEAPVEVVEEVVVEEVVETPADIIVNEENKKPEGFVVIDGRVVKDPTKNGVFSV